MSEQRKRYVSMNIENGWCFTLRSAPSDDGLGASSQFKKLTGREVNGPP